MNKLTISMRGPRHKVTFRLPLAVDAALQRAAQADGRTKSDWLREAIVAYIGGMPPPDRSSCVILWVSPRTLERLKHSARHSGRSVQEYASVLLVNAAHRPAG